MLQENSTEQAPEFSGRFRVVAVTRNLHFTERLGRLASLVERPEVVEVGPFDDTPGGELDQRLALEGLTRSDLHEDLVEIARTPRLFSLVVRLRDRLVDGGDVTIHRLLWEYGRATLAPATSAFGEQEWLSWLAEVARNRLDGMKEFDLGAIGSMVGRSDLGEAEVFRRLSDIVDSDFANRQGSHGYELSSPLVAQALIGRCVRWLSTISRDVDPPDRRHIDQERSRSQAMVARVGGDADGPLTILGHEVTFVERSRLEFGEAVAQLLEPGGLVQAIDVLELSALLSMKLRRRAARWPTMPPRRFSSRAWRLAKRAMQQVRCFGRAAAPISTA